MAPHDATAEVAAKLNLCQVCVHKLRGHYAGALCVVSLQAPAGVCLSWEATRCASVLTEDKPCGLFGRTPTMDRRCMTPPKG